jgi:two-component system sensor histidine kinase KdpD
MAEIILEKKPESAKLRIYIGAAPGVGKTYHMLNDAYLMKHQQGVDVVIGLVESHGRKDTEARIRDLEIVPQRVIPYRGVNLKEMDVDAILARHPHTAIVDELAHTNVPGSKNHKRYEDVLELLDAGINVMAAVNIQHLETLNDAVNRSANTVIRETVPDNFLKRADEVVNIDITVEELRSRLRQGKIYAAEKVEQSLANFFRKGNLNMLRELALRTTADKVSTRAAEYRRTQGLEQAPIPEKVMVCLSTRPGTERLLRVGARVAGRLASNWYAVYVTRPDDDKGHGDPEAFHRLEEYQRMARDLGAQVVSLTDRNVSDPLRPAREHLPRGLRPVGPLALGCSVPRLSAQPLSLRDSRRHRAGSPNAEALAQGLSRPIRRKPAPWCCLPWRLRPPSGLPGGRSSLPGFPA